MDRPNGLSPVGYAEQPTGEVGAIRLDGYGVRTGPQDTGPYSIPYTNIASTWMAIIELKKGHVDTIHMMPTGQVTLVVTWEGA